MSRKTYLRVIKNKIDVVGNFSKNDREEQEMEKKRFVEREAAHFFLAIIFMTGWYRSSTFCDS